MKRTLFVAMALLVVGILCVSVVWSQGRGPGRPGPGGPGGPGGPMKASPDMAVMVPPYDVFEHNADALGLGADQLTALRGAITTGQATIQPLEQKVGDACKALHESVLAPDYDSQTVAGLADAAEKAQAAVISARIGVWTQLRSILTADQVKKLQEMMPKHGPGPQGPPPGAGAPEPPPPAPGQ